MIIAISRNKIVSLTLMAQIRAAKSFDVAVYWVQPSTTRKKVRATVMIVSNVFAYVSMVTPYPALDALIAMRHAAPVWLIDRC